MPSGQDHPPPRQPLRYDPEYAAWRAPFASQVRVPPLETALAIREFNDTFMRAVWAQTPAQPSIARTRYACKSQDGTEIEVTRFATAAQTAAGSKQPLPAVLYVHGGGMVAVSVDSFAPQIARIAADSGVQVFAVEYRLAPEAPAPKPVEDCYAALCWLSSHAAELGVDNSRLGVMGDSAGGGLAAGTALMARDRGLEPPIKKQILVYPMLDDRSLAVRPSAGLEKLLTLPQPMLKLCWAAYVGEDKAGRSDADVSPYAAPGREGDLRGLPSTYMEIGGLDLFRDECAAFAARLAAVDVETEFHLFPGVPHGFDSAGDIGITKRAIEGRMRWIRDL
ncbi:Alpha/Beta hydrolase protein [Jackrogersella minutella]|nr:Alpha/Beta hydrolase protein [Jackrogersella minutella]